MGKRLAGALVAVVAILGMKFYNKASAHDDVKARLVELCEGDAACESAVAAHYDACFDASYKMGGRRTASRLDLGALVSCVNQKSGESYFAVDNEQK
jgi:hypothetical protein